MTQPLVSCVMPTRNRRRFVSQAIWYFLRQDYPQKELLVIDDGEDSVSDLLPDDDRIRYVQLDPRTVLGAKRNVGCELAHGELIAHWDDDDWSGPRRLDVQVAELRRAAPLPARGRRRLALPLRRSRETPGGRWDAAVPARRLGGQPVR